MKQFIHTISDPLGIHARPAGLLAKAAKAYPDTEITVAKDGNSARATQLMKLMGMGIRQGDRVTVTLSGPDEEPAAESIRRFFEENL